MPALLRRGAALRCKAEDIPMPEGDGLALQLRMCQRGCEFFTTDDNRGLVRQCAAGGCAEMQRCDTAQGAAP